MLPIQKPGEKWSPRWSDQPHILLIPPLPQACCVPCSHQQLKYHLLSFLSFFHWCKKENEISRAAKQGQQESAYPLCHQRVLYKTWKVNNLNDSTKEDCKQRLFHIQPCNRALQFCSTKVLLKPGLSEFNLQLQDSQEAEILQQLSTEKPGIETGAISAVLRQEPYQQVPLEWSLCRKKIFHHILSASYSL